MRFVFKLTCLAALLFGSMTIASAQYVVSAKAGLVNYVERRVTISHIDGGTERAKVGVQLENGDVVDAQGRLEILLNPGATLRLEKGSTLRVIETDFEKMQFELESGAALIEATKDMGPKRGIGLEISTKEATLVVEKYGLYEITALNGSTVVMVHKGNGDVKVAGQQTIDLKGGRQITINGSAVAEAKIDKKSNSDFEMWGQERAETLAALNNRIDIRDTLVGTRSIQTGQWFYSRFWGSYVFMPYSNFYTSPYGYWYGAYYDPYYWGNRGYVSNNSAAGGGGGGGRPSPGAKGSAAVVTPPSNGTGTSGPIKHNPSGDRPTPTSGSGRGSTVASGTRVSPGPTHVYNGGGYTRGGGGGYSGGGYSGGGGTYNGAPVGAGTGSGGSVSAPSAPSAPSSMPSKGSGSGSSAPAGGVGRARGN